MLALSSEVGVLQWMCICILVLADDSQFSDSDRVLRFRVLEELPAGSEVGIIRTRSVDGEVEFALRATSPDRRYFDVEGRTGRLLTRVVIDREQVCPHHASACTLTVDVVVGPRRYFDIIRVVVDVVDVNDHAPMFPRRSTAVTLTDCGGPATVRLPTADDDDAGPAPTYRVQRSSVPVSLAAVQLFDGSHDLRLTLNGADVARQSSVTLSVVASDDGEPPLTDLLRVFVVAACVSDITTNSADNGGGGGLTFENATYHVTISESTPVDATVVRVRALSRRHLDDVITYSLSNRSAISKMFAIDRFTGELSLRGRVVPRRSAVARLTVVASSTFSLPVYADVIIRVGDVVTTPVILLCDMCRYAVAVSEDVVPETLVAILFVRSGDDPVSCSTMTSLPFELRRAVDDVATYRLLTTSSLDREVDASHHLSVSCHLLSNTATTMRSFLDISILDVNDNKPQVVSRTPIEVIIYVRCSGVNELNTKIASPYCKAKYI